MTTLKYVIPAKAGISELKKIPTFVGMTALVSECTSVGVEHARPRQKNNRETSENHQGADQP
jgi:hypothetical protein